MMARLISLALILTLVRCAPVGSDSKSDTESARRSFMQEFKIQAPASFRKLRFHHSSGFNDNVYYFRFDYDSLYPVVDFAKRIHSKEVEKFSPSCGSVEPSWWCSSKEGFLVFRKKEEYTRLGSQLYRFIDIWVDESQKTAYIKIFYP